MPPARPPKRQPRRWGSAVDAGACRERRGSSSRQLTGPTLRISPQRERASDDEFIDRLASRRSHAPEAIDEPVTTARVGSRAARFVK